MTSPIPRTSTASASTPIAAPVAVRAWRQSWAVTAATAPNTIDTPVTPRHIAAVSTSPKPVDGHRHRHGHGEYRVDTAHHDRARRSGARIATDHRREHQFRCAAFLLGTGMANDREDRQDRGRDDQGEHQLVGHHHAQVGFPDTEHGARQDHSGGCLHQVDAGRALRLVGIGELDGIRCVHHHQRQRCDPYAEPHPVPTQRQPDEAADSGERRGCMGRLMPACARCNDGCAHRCVPWYSRRNMSSSEAGVTVRSMIPRSVSWAIARSRSLRSTEKL